MVEKGLGREGRDLLEETGPCLGAYIDSKLSSWRDTIITSASEGMPNLASQDFEIELGNPLFFLDANKSTTKT